MGNQKFGWWTVFQKSSLNVKRTWRWLTMIEKPLLCHVSTKTVVIMIDGRKRRLLTVVVGTTERRSRKCPWWQSMWQPDINLSFGTPFRKFIHLKSSVLSDEAIIGNAFVFLLAGYETTSTALGFTAWLLAKHQDVQKKLQKEIDEKLPRNVCKTFHELAMKPDEQQHFEWNSNNKLSSSCRKLSTTTVFTNCHTWMQSFTNHCECILQLLSERLLLIVSK